MKKIIQNTFLIFIILSFFACFTNPKAKVEAVVFLKDMSGKPLANRWLFLSGYVAKSDSAQTDKDGRVAFNTLWFLGNDSGKTDWSIAPKRDNKLIPVDFIFPPFIDEKAVSITDTIKMDSLRDIKIRLKSLRTDLSGYEVVVGNTGYVPGYSAGNQPREYSDSFIPFPSVHNEVKVNYGVTFKISYSGITTSLDTVINIKAFSKAGFGIFMYAYYKNNSDIRKEIIFKENQDRNGTILFEY